MKWYYLQFLVVTWLASHFNQKWCRQILSTNLVPPLGFINGWSTMRLCILCTLLVQFSRNFTLSLYFVHVALFSCCTFSVLHSFHVALCFLCCYFPRLLFCHATLFLCCTIFILIFLCCTLFVLHFLRVTLISCCTAVREFFSEQVFCRKLRNDRLFFMCCVNPVI